MNTADIIEAIRSDIKRDLRSEILAELEPEIKRQLFGNIFNTAEAMQYLRVSETTLRKMIKDGEIPYFVQRGQYFFRQMDLDRNISRKMRTGREEKIRNHDGPGKITKRL